MKIEKCCVCKKEIDVGKNEVPPVWFGMYKCGDLIKVICLDCIHKPEGEKAWRFGNDT